MTAMQDSTHAAKTRTRLLQRISRRRDCHSAAPPLLSVGVSIGMERGCQQNDNLADGQVYCRESRAVVLLHERQKAEDTWINSVNEMVETRSVILAFDMIDKVTGDSIAAQPKRWHVGRVDRFDHLFGADDDRQGDGRLQARLRRLLQPAPPGHWREFCHFADTPSPCLLKHLLKPEVVSAK